MDKNCAHFTLHKSAKIAEPGGSLDAVKRGGADAATLLAAQVTLVVIFH